MARDIGKRLSQLNTRRRGTDRLARLNAAEQSEVVRKSLTTDSWQRRATDKPYTQYALGAMQEVDADYTRKSLETAERVGKQLLAGLEAKGRTIEFRLQGSVPLNVHIRGVSDVDLLNLEKFFYSYIVTGVRAQAGLYAGTATTETSVQRLIRLRKECVDVLQDAYPATDIDTSGGKAIAISGGSLARPVDVVPSHWLDTVEWQRTQVERDRGVTILDAKVPETVDNLPFLHIDRIHSRDRDEAAGGLKKAIRLCKNVKNDAIEDGRQIQLPSFDLAGIMYHANQAALRNNAFFELEVLAETQRFLEYLVNNKPYALSLDVPDGSRRIFNTDAKFEALVALSSEIDDLAREVAMEQDVLLRLKQSLQLDEGRRALEKVYVPAA